MDPFNFVAGLLIDETDLAMVAQVCSYGVQLGETKGLVGLARELAGMGRSWLKLAAVWVWVVVSDVISFDYRVVRDRLLRNVAGSSTLSMRV
jgi:hypothetical protein